MSADIEEYIQRKVDAGEFHSREEFVAVAVSMYRDLEEHDALRREIERRLADADAGRVAPLDVSFLKATLVAEFSQGGLK